MNDSAPVVVRAAGLARRYGTVDAVRDLDLTVRRGEVYGFLGPNGAGKTTTLLMLLGIERPDAGTVELFGQPGPPDPFRDKPRIGVVGEAQYLYDDLSAWEYLQFFGQLYGVQWPKRRAQELLERLELFEFRRLRARDYSRGMQQKLGLARALLHQPELLVLDEPVSGLDPHGIRQVREILSEERARGTTILLSSHILSEVERTADRVGILYGGRLVAEDTVERLSAQLEPDPVLEVDVEGLTAETLAQLRAQPFVSGVEQAVAGQLRVRVSSDGDYRRAVSELVSAGGGLITGMRQEHLSLEEAFVRLTSGGRAPSPQPPPPCAGEGEQGRTVGTELTSLTVERPQTQEVAPSPHPICPPGPCAGEGEQTRSGETNGLGPAGDASPLTPSATPTPSPVRGRGGRGEGAARRPGANGTPRASAPAAAQRWRAVWTIARRDLFGMLYGPGIYLVVALGMLATLPIVAGYVEAVERTRLLILADAFTLPFFVAATIGMLFLALASVATIAREREGGTLEVLFYGPVDHLSYVLGKGLAHLLAFLPIVLGLAALLLAYSGMTGLRLPSAFGLELLLAVCTAAAVAALGVCLSTLARGVRAGIALLGGLTVVFLAVRAASELLSAVPVTNNLSPLLFLRKVVLGVDWLVGYISPFSLFQSGVDALVRQDLAGYFGMIALSWVYTGLLLTAAVRLLARPGRPPMMAFWCLFRLPLSLARERGLGGGGFLLLCLLLLLATPALAQTPQRERRFVYGLNLFDGTEYATGFAPHTVDAVYQLAGHVGVLDPKITEVYFWPITNEMRPDFASLNELAPGKLEIGQAGRVLETLELTEYVVQIDPAAGLAGGKVFLGAEAQARWAFFQTERAAYLERLRLHTEAMLEHNRRLEELRAASAAGAIIALEPPPEPAAFSLYSTEIGRGFAVQLPPGEYTIRLREPGGKIVEDSEKRLIVFAPRRAGVGYEVIPQERWTFPEQAREPAEVMYTAPGGVAYLRTFAAHEVNAEAQARLRNPQDLAAAPNRWQWVNVGPLGPATLLAHDGVREQRLQVSHFTVEQAPGGVLGYRVVPFVAAGARTPDITAYRVEAPAGRGVVRLRLVDADGRELVGSAREVVVVSSVPGWQLALPVVVPLLIGLTVILWRRAQVQSARSLTDEQRRRLA